MALFNNFPYSNTEEINLDYTLNKLNELYSRGENLYAELQSWKTATDEANEAWKSDLLSDINEWQTSVTRSLEQWKSSVDSEVANALTSLSNQITAELAQAKTDLRSEVADLASAAAASAAEAGASQSAAAQSAQNAINSAAAAAQSAQNISESTEQINTNKDDISDLNSAISGIVNISVSPRFEQGFWSATPSTTRRDYVRTKSGITVAEGDIVAVNMNEYTGTEVQFNYYNADTYVSRITVRSANFVNGIAYATTPSGVDNVRINIYSGGSSIYIEPDSYDSLQIYKNPITPISDTINDLYVNVAIPFEIGIITITSNGWTYPDENTTKRIRTIANESIRLYSGDKIRILPNKNIRAYVGWKSDDGSYSHKPWFTGEMDITVNGEYVISVAYNPDRVITDFGDIASSVYIVRSYGAYLADLEIQKSRLITKYNNFNSAKRNVRSINHRGWYTAPENTIVAFAQSKYYGFDCIETDVRATSDGVFVLLHDDTITRTSNGTGSIADMTYDEVLQYDFGAYKAAKYAGTKIPTLQELLEFCKWTSIEPYLEIKNILTDTQIRQVVDIVADYGMLDNVTFFGDSHVADVISQYNNDVRVGILLFSDVTQSAIDSITAIKARGNDVFLDAKIELLTDNGVELAKNSGIPIEVWNANKNYMAITNTYVSGYTSDNFVASLYMANDVYNPMI